MTACVETVGPHFGGVGQVGGGPTPIRVAAGSAFRLVDACQGGLLQQSTASFFLHLPLIPRIAPSYRSLLLLCRWLAQCTPSACSSGCRPRATTSASRVGGGAEGRRASHPRPACCACALQPMGPATACALQPMGPATACALQPMGPAMACALQPTGPATACALQLAGLSAVRCIFCAALVKLAVLRQPFAHPARLRAAQPAAAPVPVPAQRSQPLPAPAPLGAPLPPLQWAQCGWRPPTRRSRFTKT